MFLFKKKSSGKSTTKDVKRTRKTELPGFDGINAQVDVDADLEAELLALTGGTKADLIDPALDGGDDDEDLDSELERILGQTKRKPKFVDKLVRAPQPQLSQDESDGEIDENDPELLSELVELTGEGTIEDVETNDGQEDDDDARIPSQMELIADRLSAYKDLASSAAAAGDMARQRRFNRGIKTLEKQLRDAKSGKIIPPEEIPPEIARPNTNKPKKASREISTQPETVSPILDSPENNTDQDVRTDSLLDTVQHRLNSYREAEQLATSFNEPAKARRYKRGVKTLENLLKQAQAGQEIVFGDIPPEISKPKPSTNNAPAQEVTGEISDSAVMDITDRLGTINIDTPDTQNLPETEVTSEKENFKPTPCLEPEPSSLPSPSRPSNILDTGENVKKPDDPENSVTDSTNAIQQLIEQRRIEYKKEALLAKKSGDMQKAIELVKNVKILDGLLERTRAGKLVEEIDIPPAPNMPSSVATLKVPRTVMEALQQRLDYYVKAEKTAQMRGEAVKLKRFSGIVQIYRNAIKLHQKGSSIPYERLPTPPGYPPIPISFKIG